MVQGGLVGGQDPRPDHGGASAVGDNLLETIPVMPLVSPPPDLAALVRVAQSEPTLVA